MALFLAYVMVGLAVAMPVGAITIEMTNQGLKNGFFHGWAVGLGGMTIDFVMILALYLGLASFLQFPFVQIPMWLIGAVFLFLIAFDSIKNAENDMTLVGEKPTKSLMSSYRNGFLVAVSPGNIIFWLTVFGSGILIHDIGLLSIVSTSRRVMSKKMIKGFSIVAGIILIGFSGYFMYQFLMAIMEIA